MNFGKRLPVFRIASMLASHTLFKMLGENTMAFGLYGLIFVGDRLNVIADFLRSAFNISSLRLQHLVSWAMIDMCSSPL